jgi:hypothetical protein
VARFRKEVMSPGVYHTPKGVQVVTAARMRRWADQVQQLVRAGYRPPVSWGHAPSAVPHTEDDAAFWSSKLVAGKLLGANINARGRLEIHADAPGVDVDAEGRLTTLTELPDGRKVRSAIEEVSIGAIDWVDGRGTTWQDAPVHVALTPLPVWVPEGGQPPFELIDETKPDGTPAHFGSASLLYPFATEVGDVDDEKKDPPETDSEGGETDEAPEVGLPEVLDALASIGLVLPESTTEATLMRDIVVGAAAIAGAAGDDTDGDTGMDAGSAAPPSEAGGGAGGAFMSTLQNDPIGKALIAQLTTTERERRLTRLAGLARRGLTVHHVGKLRQQITAVQFSTTASGQPARASVDDVLDALEAALPPEESSPYAALFGASVPTPPEGDDASRQKADAAIADEIARNSGLPQRRKGA